jgi:RNA polymerase sigma-70 factor (ECF subfamily)
MSSSVFITEGRQSNRKANGGNVAPAMPHEETARLFERACQGDDPDVEAFYRRCAAKLLPFIRLRMGRALRDELESRDVLQAVLVKALPRLPQVKEPGAVMAWLSRIAENEIRDRVDHRQRQRRDAALRVPIDDVAHELPSPVRQALSQAIVNEDMARLERALEALPGTQREAIVLRKLEELTFPEMAARLGKSEDACRMTYTRAMAALTLQLRTR